MQTRLPRLSFYDGLGDNPFVLELGKKRTLAERVERAVEVVKGKQKVQGSPNGWVGEFNEKMVKLGEGVPAMEAVLKLVCSDVNKIMRNVVEFYEAVPGRVLDGCVHGIARDNKDLQKEAKMLSEKLKDAEVEASRLRGENKKLESENSRLGGMLGKYLDNLFCCAEELGVTVRPKSAGVVRDVFRDVTEEVGELKEAAEMMKRDLEKKHSHDMALLREIEDLQEKLTTLQADYEAETCTSRTLSKQVKVLQADTDHLTKLQSKITSLEATTTSLSTSLTREKTRSSHYLHLLEANKPKPCVTLSHFHNTYGVWPVKIEANRKKDRVQTFDGVAVPSFLRGRGVVGVVRVKPVTLQELKHMLRDVPNDPQGFETYLQAKFSLREQQLEYVYTLYRGVYRYGLEDVDLVFFSRGLEGTIPKGFSEWVGGEVEKYYNYRKPLHNMKDVRSFIDAAFQWKTKIRRKLLTVTAGGIPDLDRAFLFSPTSPFTQELRRQFLHEHDDSLHKLSELFSSAATTPGASIASSTLSDIAQPYVHPNDFPLFTQKLLQKPPASGKRGLQINEALWFGAKVEASKTVEEALAAAAAVRLRPVQDEDAL